MGALVREVKMSITDALYVLMSRMQIDETITVKRVARLELIESVAGSLPGRVFLTDRAGNNYAITRVK